MPSLFGSDRSIKSVSDWYKDYSNAGSWNPQPGVEPPAEETETTSPPVTAAPPSADNTQSTQDTSSSTGDSTSSSTGSGTPLQTSIDPQSFKDNWVKSFSDDKRIDAQDFKGKWGMEAQGFKDKWMSGGSGDSDGGGQQAAASNNAAAITAQDMTPTQEQGFDTAKWGYNAGSAPKFEGMQGNIQKMVAGLDYSVQQDRNYWAAKADKTRGETFGDVWKMEAPTWKRWEEPEEIKTTWQDKDDDD